MWCNYPLKEWCFEKYFFSTHDNINKLKNFKRITDDYHSGLSTISQAKGVPKPVKTHCNKLKNETLVNRSRFVVLVL
jgi:hypothetical protein